MFFLNLWPSFAAAFLTFATWTGAVLDFLQRASSYPDRPGSVEAVETHISWVFLTDRYAYKLKKPVSFEFLDFSTAELRRRDNGIPDGCV